MRRMMKQALYTPISEVYYCDHITNNDIEVVGNIHDNPELLKGGAE